MFCDEALDLIESIAEGELTPEGRVAAHLATCPNCAAALASARRLEQALRARPVPRAPARFTARMMTTLRRKRWRSEQFLDVGFNVALAAVGLIVVGGVLMLLSHAGLMPAGNGALGLVSGGVAGMVRRAVAAVPVYVGAAALLAVALGVWWWAERGTQQL